MKKEKDWKLIKKEPAIDLNILNIEHHHYRNPRNDKVVKTVAINGNDAVNVIALTKDKKVLLVRQFRFGIGDYTIELPGGMVDEGESNMDAVQRELREETGFAGTNWQKIGSIYSNPVFMNSKITHFMVESASAQYPLELDDAEDVEILTLSIKDVYDWIDEEKIQHPHTISAFCFARNLLKGYSEDF